MHAKNITGMEQMEQDKEAWMIKAVRNCKLIEPSDDLAHTVFYLIQVSEVQSQIQVLSTDLSYVSPQSCYPGMQIFYLKKRSASNWSVDACSVTISFASTFSHCCISAFGNVNPHHRPEILVSGNKSFICKSH